MSALSARQVCGRLGLAHGTVNRYSREDPTFPARGSDGRFDSDEIDAWLQTHRVKPGTLGYCYAEPARLYKPRDVTPAEWFWVRVGGTPSGRDECWPWVGPLVDGYGLFYVSPTQTIYAHRYAYELLVGPIPDGLTVDHLCNKRACVRPSHMELVTHVENVQRGYERRGMGRARSRPVVQPVVVIDGGAA